MDSLKSWFFKSKDIEELKFRVFLSYTSVGVITTFIYSFIGFTNGHLDVGYFDLFLGFSFLFVSLISVSFKNLKVYKTVGLIPILMWGSFNFVNGGMADVAIYFIFAIPPLVFFIQSINKAVLTNLVFLLILILFYIFGEQIGVKRLYSDAQFVTFIVAFLLDCYIVLMFKLGWNVSEEFLEIKTKELMSHELELKKKIKELEDVKSKLNKKTKSIQKSKNETEEINKNFINRELKMVELKQRIEELESKLSSKKN